MIDIKNTQLINALRGIRQSFLSWLAISIVTMLGCGVFFGAYFYTQSILGNTEAFFAATNFEDFNVLPTGGLKEDEIDELRSVPGVSDVEGTYRLSDSILSIGGRSIDAELIGLTRRISTPQLLEGTLPVQDGECALCREYMEQYDIHLGDGVELTPGKDSPEGLLRSSSFRVTASIRHPDSLWTGDTKVMVFLPLEAFDTESVDNNFTYLRLDADIPSEYGMFSTAYEENLIGVKTDVRSRLRTLTASHDERLRADAQAELDDAKAEAKEKLADASKEIDDAEQKIADAKGKISDADGKVADAEQKLQDARKELDDKEKELKTGKKKLKKAKKKLSSMKKKLNQGKKKLNQADKKLAAEQKKLNRANQKLKDAEKKLKAEKQKLKNSQLPEAMLQSAKAELAAKEKELQKQRKEYDKGKKKLASAKKKLSGQKAEYRKAKKQYNQANRKVFKQEKKLHKGENEIADARSELADKEREVEEKKQELSEKKQELKDGEKDLAEGKRKYREKKAETDRDIADAQQKIDDLADSACLFITRTELDSFVMFRDDVNIMVQLPTVFVTIFTMIGLIVVFSTITIQIDNQKKLIGTMKAFGFRNREIVSDYVFFGVSASALGMLLAVGLCALLQRVFYNQMGSMFSVKPNLFTLRMGIVLPLTVLELLLSAAVAAFVTVHHATRHSAVALMQGNTSGAEQNTAPGTGVGTLYSRLIMRNIRSDLARVIVTTVIVAGCCLVMGMGFTLDDALGNMMPRSAEEINHYQLELSVTAQGEEGDYKRLADYLQGQNVEFTQALHKNTMYCWGEQDGVITVITAEDRVFGDYIHLLPKNGRKSITLSETGPMVASKVSERTGICSGTELSIYDSDNDYTLCPTTVGDVCRTYFGRNIYFSLEDYVTTFGAQPEFNTLLVRLNREEQDEFVNRLQEQFPQVSVVFTDVMPRAYEGPASLFHIMVFVMTLLSGILSVFVLTNLVNIFVQRRHNELIIMSINGFGFSDLIGYLLKETLMTTCMGLMLGTVGGCAMTGFVVRMVEGADAMFVRTPNPKAWLYAIALEGVFSTLINLVAFRRVKRLRLTDINR